MSEEESAGKIIGSGKKTIVYVIIIIAIISGLYLLYLTTPSPSIANPDPYFSIISVNNTTTFELVSIDYKYPIECFNITNMTVSISSTLSIDDNLSNGDYFFKGKLIELHNNVSRPVVFYDNDNDFILSEGDTFISDSTNFPEENIKNHEFILWINYNNSEIRLNM